MRPPRAVVYGVGAMGSIATRVLLERGVEIVGAIARSPENVGQDLGRVTGLGRDLGVAIDSDADRVLTAAAADVAIVSVNSYLSDHATHIERCVRSGTNVLTLCEEAFFPSWTSPGLTRHLDAVARANSVSILGTGHQDAFWFGIGALLLGSVARIDAVRWTSLWNPEGGGVGLLAAMGIGEEPASPASIEGDSGQPSFAVAAVDALAASLGFDRGERTTTRVPIIADAPWYSSSLQREISAGHVIGVSDTVTRRSADAPELQFTMTGRLFARGEEPGETWDIAGEPNIRASSTYEAGHMQVIAQVVHRIPDVIAARPGWVFPADLPLLQHRAKLWVDDDSRIGATYAHNCRQ